MTEPPDTTSLVADIGGTNTRVALVRDGVLIERSIRRYANVDYPGLGEVLAAYREAEANVDCAGACIAVAGPVRDGVGTLTNLDWTMDDATLKQATGAETVAILNDLQAQGHSLGYLPVAALNQVKFGHTATPGASQLVIGVGTGFNAAPVHETAGGRFVAPSECGHASLAVHTEADLRLVAFVRSAHGFPGVEDVLSGRGLSRIYAWLSTEKGQPKDRRAGEIVEAIGQKNDPLAAEAGRIFVRHLGAVASDLALIHLPFGGIYLIGGVARAFAPHFAEFGFVDAFHDKGRFSGFLHAFPVFVIEDDYAALTGCAVYLDGLMNR